MAYGEVLKAFIDSSGISKTYICESLGISRPYLYAVFSGATPPPVPEKQIQLADLLNANKEQRSMLFDLAASERNEPPADVAQCIKDPSFLNQIREEFIYSAERLELDER